MLSWRIKSTLALLVLAALLAGFGVYLVVTQARDLTRTRVELQEMRASMSATRFTLLYAEDALNGFKDIAARFHGFCAKRGLGATAKGFCNTQGPSFEVLALNNEAIRARLIASETGDYGRMRDAYAALAVHLAARPADSWQRGWLGRTKEGIAYAEMKSSRLEAAQAAIIEAQHLAPESALVWTTALKIDCAQNEPARKVQARFGAVLQALDARVAASTRNQDLKRTPEQRKAEIRDASAERSIMERDLELYRLCDYADLSKRDA